MRASIGSKPANYFRTARSARLHREGLHDLAIIRPQFCVMALHDTHIVAQSGCDSVDVASLARSDRLERMTHHVRGEPRNSLRLHEFGKGAPKIEPIAMGSVRHIRLQNVG